MNNEQIIEEVFEDIEGVQTFKIQDLAVLHKLMTRARVDEREKIMQYCEELLKYQEGITAEENKENSTKECHCKCFWNGFDYAIRRVGTKVEKM